MADFEARLIEFNDIKPPGAHLDECAGGIGIDHEGRVYFAAQDDRDPQDVAIFRYDTKTGGRELLGTARGIAAHCENLGPNEHWPREEAIAKIHVAFIEHEGRIYFATHNFADPMQAYRTIYDDLALHRGAHIFAYDIAAETFEDVTKSAPGGVAAKNESIAGLTVMPGHDKLVAFTFPHGDIVIHDLNTGETRRYDGAPEYRTDRSVNVAREIIATKQGKVFLAYEKDNFHLHTLDLDTGAIARTMHRNSLRTGYICGMASKKDGSVIYLVDLRGNLYAFETDADRLRDLGNLLTDAEWKKGARVTSVHGIALSRDERTLYTIPSRIISEHPIKRAAMRLLTRAFPKVKAALARWRLSRLEARAHDAKPVKSDSGRAPAALDATSSKLYTYDIATGEKRIAGRFPNLPMGSWISGNGVIDDEGRLYYCYHTLNRNGARLVQISPVSDRGTSSSVS
ncbi:MAG: hypothetical protein HKN20_14235 [Gemmatimonadetes bacterium]|nr:hypothetical protein [Gemmatimonadota bacterium]